MMENKTSNMGTHTYISENYEYAKMLENLGCLFSINVCDPKKRSVLLLLS